MKPKYHKVPITIENSFSIRYDISPNFGTLWHYHPELELHFTIKGEGVKFIGDNISNFSEGDMILLGENLPHTWRCREAYFQGNGQLKTEALVLHFHPACLGRDFLNLPEAYLIPRLLEKAKKGLSIQGKSKERLVNLMFKALDAKNLDRIIHLIEILKILTESEEMDTIAPAYAFNPQTNIHEMARLEKIFTYLLANYQTDIQLQEVASLANMSETSFCRYFKTMTNKTFSALLMEIRVSHVCRALIEDRLPTEVICFEAGFHNISNFYRQFKKITKMTPYAYKKKYLSGREFGSVAEN